MKKLVSLLLAFAFIVGVFVFNAPKDIVLAESNHFGGYYETLGNSAVLDAGQSVGSALSGTITGVNQTGGSLSETVSVSVNGNTVTITQLPSNVQDSMVLGNYYTLTVNNINVDFRFVTKAIKDKNDIGVLNLTDPNTAITGYYVLANDLKLEKGEENKHDVNGSSKGHGINFETKGFRGTFDGQGHNIEFWANEAGFFGALSIGGVIKNTGFVNVRVYTQGANPVLFHGATHLYKDDRALVENVYIRMADGEIPEGAICMTGSIPLMLRNVVLDFPGANIDHSTGDISVGALWGADYGWWVADGANMKVIQDPLSYKDVYIIGRMPAMHYKHIPTENVEGKKGFYVRENGTLARGWMEGYAENEGVEEDIYNGEKVYKGVRKYSDLSLLSDDKQNDYSTFDKRYWGVEEYGLPVWLNGVEGQYNIFLKTDGQKTSAAFYLELGGVDSAVVGFGLGGISVEGVPLTFEFLKGEEFISIDSETGVVTALKEGMSQFKIKCSYNGKNFEKKYTVYVTAAEGYEPPKTSGCGTFIVTGGTIGGGALMILSALAFTLLRNKKKFA